jgi:hypothetical protein
LVERVLGKDEVTSSILVNGSSNSLQGIRTACKARRVRREGKCNGKGKI